ALRLERDRPAERQPQEQDQAEARQREARHHEHATGARGLLLHQPPLLCRRGAPAEVRSAAAFGAAVEPGHTVVGAGGLSRLDSVPSTGFAAPMFCSSASDAHDVTTRPRRTGPWASCVEKMDAPAWLAHDVQNRKPSSEPGGL